MKPYLLLSLVLLAILPLSFAQKAKRSNFSTSVKEKTARKKPSRLFQAQKDPKERTLLSSPFSRAVSKPWKAKRKSDPFSREVHNKTKRTKPSSSPFSKPGKEQKGRTLMPSPFSTPRKQRKSLTELSSAFSSEIPASNATAEKYQRPSKRLIYPKSFPFEPLQLFARDPNAKRKRKLKPRNHRDPFSKSRRKEKPGQAAQELDLFPNGVMPKMR